MSPSSDLGAENEEIYLVGAWSRQRFHWTLSHSLVSAFWALWAPFYMSSWIITCYLFHKTYYFTGCVCAELQLGYRSVAGISSQITKVTTISVQVGFVVERVTLGHPPPLIPFALLSIIPQLMSVYVYHKNYTISWLLDVFPLLRLCHCHQFLWRCKTPERWSSRFRS